MPIIIDGHQDIALNFVTHGRDFREPLAAIRQREHGTDIITRTGTATSTLDAALAGGVGLIFATLFVNPPWTTFGKVYHTPQEAEEQALEQLAYYEVLATHPQVTRVLTRADLDRVRATWSLPGEQRVIGLVTLMEGADPIVTPEDFPRWYERGVRIVGLTWSRTRYAGGTLMKGIGGGPVTPEGFALMQQMARHNAILDLSHLSEEAFYQSVDAYPGVVIASHSNPRSFRSSDRHLTDDMIQRVAARGGVIGLVPYNAFLTDEAASPTLRETLRLSRYAEAIDTVCQITGSADHAAIGSDIDGGFGQEMIPHELDSLADFQRIAEALAAMDYTDHDIALICHGNWLRMLEATLPRT